MNDEPGREPNGRGARQANVRALLGLFESYRRDLFALDPIEGSEAGDRGCDSRLSEFSESRYRAQIDLDHHYRRLAGRIAPEALPVQWSIDREYFISRLDSEARLLEELRPWETDPVAPLTRCTEACYLIWRRGMGNPAALPALTERILALPGVLRQSRQALGEPALHKTRTAIEVCRGSIEFFEHIRAVMAPGPALDRAFRRALDALAEHRAFLATELSRRSHGRAAIGRDLFAYLLQHRHRVSIPPEELLRMGEEAFADVRRAMQSTLDQMGVRGSWVDAVEASAEPTTDPDRLAEFYQGLVEQTRAFVTGRRLASIPSPHPLVVVETPEHERPLIPHAAYQPQPVLDPSEPALFFVTPPAPGEPQRAANSHRLSAAGNTVVHEAYPGHHLQFSAAIDHPSPLRRFFAEDMLCEGWAFYCEETMLLAGYRPGALTELLVRKGILWRTARVILDVSLHLDRMTPDEAVEFLGRAVGFDPGFARREVHRYLLEPTQPLTYWLGKQMILELRDAWDRRHGTAALGEFHDALLAQGSLPFDLLRAALFQPEEPDQPLQRGAGDGGAINDRP